MFAKIILVSFVATCAVLVSSTFAENVEITSYPYVVSIEYYKMHACVGALISSSVVLTTAHCASGFDVNMVGVRAGSAVREDYNGEYVQLRKVKDTVLHPQYQDEGDDYNVAVYILEEPFELNDHVNVVKVSDQEDLVSKTFVVGWGRNSKFEEAPQIRAVEMFRGASAACETFYQGTKTISERMFCGIPMEVICQNLGSPAVYHYSNGDSLVGIVSYTEVKRVYKNHLKGNGPLEQKTCATEKPLILMRVAPFKQWLGTFL